METNFNNISYSIEDIKNLLKDNNIHINENSQQNISSIFQQADTNKGDDAGKLTGNEIVTFLNKTKETLGKNLSQKIEKTLIKDTQKFNKINDNYGTFFENLEFDANDFERFLTNSGFKKLLNNENLFNKIQENNKFANDGNNNKLSKQEIANFLLIAQDKLSKSDFNKLTTILGQMENAEANKITNTTDGITTEVVEYPSVDNKLSDAAKIILEDLKIPVKEIEKGEFDSVQIVTKTINGEEVRSAILTSSKHAYTFEIDFPSDSDISNDATGNETISKMSYKGNGKMVLENVNIKRIDIGYNPIESESHSLIFSNSSLGNVINSSRHAVHLVDRVKSNKNLEEDTYPNSYIKYQTDSNSDTYTREYILAKHHHSDGKPLGFYTNSTAKPNGHKTDGDAGMVSGGRKEGTVVEGPTIGDYDFYTYHKKNIHVNLGPGYYISRGEVDSKKIENFVFGCNDIIPEKKYVNNIKNNRQSNKDVIQYLEEHNNAVFEKDGDIYIQGTEDIRTGFHESKITTRKELDFANPLRTNMNSAKEIIENIDIPVDENGNFAIKEMNHQEFYNYLTETCKLNKKTIQSFIKAGFHNLQITKDDSGNAYLTFISKKGYSFKMNMLTLFKYNDDIEIDIKKDSNTQEITEMSFNNIKGVLKIDNISNAPTFFFENVILDLEIDETLNDNKICEILHINTENAKRNNFRVNLNNPTYASSKNATKAEKKAINAKNKTADVIEVRKKQKGSTTSMRTGFLGKGNDNIDPLLER